MFEPVTSKLPVYILSNVIVLKIFYFIMTSTALNVTFVTLSQIFSSFNAAVKAAGDS
jgi:hypothetical protein